MCQYLPKICHFSENNFSVIGYRTADVYFNQSFKKPLVSHVIDV